MSDSESSLREALREARRVAGLTTEQLSARTNIRCGILRDLENGVVASSGGAVYARGHLKAIAGVTGVDPVDLLAPFDREVQNGERDDAVDRPARRPAVVAQPRRLHRGDAADEGHLAPGGAGVAAGGGTSGPDSKRPVAVAGWLRAGGTAALRPADPDGVDRASGQAATDGAHLGRPTGRTPSGGFGRWAGSTGSTGWAGSTGSTGSTGANGSPESNGLGGNGSLRSDGNRARSDGNRAGSDGNSGNGSAGCNGAAGHGANGSTPDGRHPAHAAGPDVEQPAARRPTRSATGTTRLTGDTAAAAGAMARTGRAVRTWRAAWTRPAARTGRGPWTGREAQDGTPRVVGGAFRLPVAAPPERRTPRWGVAAAVAIAVLAVVVIVGALRPASSGRQSAAALPSAAAPAAPPAQPVAAPPPAAPAVAALQLRIAHGSSWVRIRNTDSVLVEQVLAGGYSRDFTDPARLDVVVGRKGNVELTCAGKPVPLAGAGDVLRLRCTPGGVVPA